MKKESLKDSLNSSLKNKNKDFFDNQQIKSETQDKIFDLQKKK